MKRTYTIALAAACPFPSSQGSQVLIKQLAEALIERGHRVHMVTYHFGEDLDCSLFSIHRIPGIIPYEKFRAGPSWKKPLLDFFLSIKLFQVVNRYTIDIIHAHNYEAALSGFLVRLFTGVPVIFHSHSAMADELHTYCKGNFNKFLANKTSFLLDKIVPLWSNHSIVVAQETKSFFVSRGVSEQKIDFIPPGISYKYPLKRDEKIRDRYSIGRGPIILYTGNLDKYQNIDLLLESFQLVARDFVEANLVILTHNDITVSETLFMKRNFSNRVVPIRVSSFEEVQHFLDEATLAVVPRVSWSGFPIKLLNYMAAGKAIVACESAAKGLEHLKDGFIVKDGDYTALGEAVKTLLRDSQLCQMLGENARKKAERCYGWDKIVLEIEKVYDKVQKTKK